MLTKLELTLFLILGLVFAGVIYAWVVDDSEFDKAVRYCMNYVASRAYSDKPTIHQLCMRDLAGGARD